MKQDIIQWAADIEARAYNARLPIDVLCAKAKTSRSAWQAWKKGVPATVRKMAAIEDVLREAEANRP